MAATKQLTRSIVKKTRNILFSIQGVRNSSTGFNFSMTDTDREVKELARKFTREEIMPVAAHHDETREFPMEIFKKAWSIGLLNGNVPKHVGGLEQGTLTTGLIEEEMAYGCTGIGNAVNSSGLGLTPLIYAGTKEQQKRFLGRLIEEPLMAAYCVSEVGAGSDVAAIKTSAVKKGDEYILNGHKMWVTNGGFANWYFVLARTNPDPQTPINKAFTGFIVERSTSGITLGRKEETMGQKAGDTRGITFEDVRIPKENVVGNEGAGFRIAMETFDATRSTVGAACTGLMQRCLDEASKYANERKTFGTAIGNHQGVAFLLAEMAMAIELSKLAWLKAAWQYDNGQKCTKIASIAKLYSSEMANKVASNTVHIFGGNGYSKAYPVEKLMRDAKIFTIYEGTSEIQKIIISRHVLRMAKEQL